MDWQDEKVEAEFEDYLRRFQPLKPKPLPTRRPMAVGLAVVAAVVVGAVLVPMRFASNAPPAHDVTPTSTPTPPAAGHSTDGTDQTDRRETPPVETRVPNRETTPPVAERGASAPSNSSGLSIRGEPSDALPSRGVTVTSGAVTRRVRAGEGVKPPTKVVDARPVYPKGAQDAGIQGIVVLEVVIGEDGSVIGAQVVRSIPELDQAAIDAVLQWQFEPTLLNGEPIEVEMSVVVNFTLQK